MVRFQSAAESDRTMSLKVAQTLWRGKADHNAAWQISNGVIRLVVTKLGGCVVMYLPHSHFFLNG